VKGLISKSGDQVVVVEMSLDHHYRAAVEAFLNSAAAHLEIPRNEWSIFRFEFFTQGFLSWKAHGRQVIVTQSLTHKKGVMDRYQQVVKDPRDLT